MVVVVGGVCEKPLTWLHPAFSDGWKVEAAAEMAGMTHEPPVIVS